MAKLRITIDYSFNEKNPDKNKLIEETINSIGKNIPHHSIKIDLSKDKKSDERTIINREFLGFYPEIT